LGQARQRKSSAHLTLSSQAERIKGARLVLSPSWLPQRHSAHGFKRGHDLDVIAQRIGGCNRRNQQIPRGTDISGGEQLFDDETFPTGTRHRLGVTEIAAILGVSKQCVTAIEQRALGNLMAGLEARGLR
jgi:hypothetical protein